VFDVRQFDIRGIREESLTTADRKIEPTRAWVYSPERLSRLEEVAETMRDRSSSWRAIVYAVLAQVARVGHVGRAGDVPLRDPKAT